MLKLTVFISHARVVDRLIAFLSLPAEKRSVNIPQRVPIIVDNLVDEASYR